MGRIKTFEQFSTRINEETDSDLLVSKVIKVSFDIDWNKNIGKMEQDVVLAMSPNSLGMYELAKDIEKYTGLPKSDAEEYDETPEDAFVYGMVNAMNGGKDLFFWTNGTRLAGAAKKVGLWPAICEQISHECVHLGRQILAKNILERNGSKDWTSDVWPSVGDDPKENLIDDEGFSTVVGIIVEQLTNEFLKMASLYIPELKNKTIIK